MTQFDFEWSSNEQDPDASTNANYANNTNVFGWFYANRNVIDVSFLAQSFDLEVGDDFLRFNQYFGMLTNYSAAYSNNTWLNPNILYPIQYQPIELKFDTDSSSTRPGFAFSQVKVCCSSNPGPDSTAAQLFRGERATGVLLATQDYVRFKLPTGPSGTILNIITGSGPTSSGADFDVFVRCNAAPTNTLWNYRGVSGDAMEFVSITEGAGVCSGTWHVAIHSYSGSGQFYLTAHRMRVDQLIPVV